MATTAESADHPAASDHPDYGVWIDETGSWTSNDDSVATYDSVEADLEEDARRFYAWLVERERHAQAPTGAPVITPLRVPRRGHVGPRQSHPRGRAQARASSRGGDSGDSSDDPEPAGPGDPVGDTSRSLDQLARRPLQPKRDLLRQLAERQRALDDLARGWRS